MSATIVCLHGWGGSKESFVELREALKNDPITILTPDLPGFGSEPEPKEAWNTDDYADWVEEWLKKNEKIEMKNEKFFLLGHSHGGRIALKLALRQATNNFSFFTGQFSHLFLCAPAGIRHVRHFKRIIGLMLAKTGKILFSVPGLRSLSPLGKKLLYKLVRVHDYEKATDVMRKTLIKVTEEDLRPILGSVQVAVDLFWGTDDGMTPYSDALLMKNRIAHSVLHTYPGVRHAVHRDRAREIAEVIRSRMVNA